MCDELCGKVFEISPTAFYQVNAECAEAMRCTGEPQDASSPAFPGFGCTESAMFGNLCGIHVPHNIAAVRTCPVCSSTLSGIAESGSVGCACCYQTFREELCTAVHAVPDDARYPGRTPRKFRLKMERAARAALLRDQMKQAVLAEDFETAALLRDQIHTLQTQD